MTTVHQVIERFVRAETAPDLASGIAEVIDLAAVRRPHTDWARLRSIDLSREAAHLSTWFEASLVSKQSLERLHGLFFNVCNPILDDGGVTTDLALAATARSAREDQDWLFTQFDQPYAFAYSPFLHELYGIACGTRDYRHPVSGVLENDAEYPLGLSYAVLAARAIMHGRTARDAPRGGDVVSVAAGFGEGDIALVGELTSTGFLPNAGELWA